MVFKNNSFFKTNAYTQADAINAMQVAYAQGRVFKTGIYHSFY